MKRNCSRWKSVRVKPCYPTAPEHKARAFSKRCVPLRRSEPSVSVHNEGQSFIAAHNGQSPVCRDVYESRLCLGRGVVLAVGGLECRCHMLLHGWRSQSVELVRSRFVLWGDLWPLVDMPHCQLLVGRPSTTATLAQAETLSYTVCSSFRLLLPGFAQPRWWLSLHDFCSAIDR